jgi:hypothetical protein
MIKKWYIPIPVFFITGLFAFPLAQLIYSFLLFLSLLVFIILFVIKLVKKKRKNSLLSFIIFLNFSFIISILISFFIPLKKPLPTNTENIASTLKYIYDVDQKDRMDIRIFIWDSYRKKIKERDKMRLHFVNYLLEANKISTPTDKYLSAMIFQHGDKPEHYEKAYLLASEAAKANVQNAEWLSKAAFDRWMISIGEKPKYGTQIGKN